LLFNAHCGTYFPALSLAYNWVHPSMENSASNRIEAELARRFENCIEAGSIANELVSLWLEIDVVLSPIMGQRGVVALYQRSLHLTARVHPWLADFQDESQSSPDYTQLKTLLIQQQCAELVVASSLL